MRIKKALLMKKNDTLVWIDLEMSGLDPRADVILEIATIITDGELNEQAVGPHLVIHHSQEKLQRMNKEVMTMHKKSGLLDAVEKSVISHDEAQKDTLNFIKQYCAPQTALLCGNSVWQDRNFLFYHMTQILDYMHYRLIDVTTVKELVARWYPNNLESTFKKQDTHRALQDIRESIAELKHFRKYFFMPQKPF